MAQPIKVSTKGLKTKATELRQRNAQLKKQIEELARAEEILNKMWDGEANDKFHGAFCEDVGKMWKFYNEIEKCAQKLETIAGNYDKAEAKSRQIAGH